MVWFVFDSVSKFTGPGLSGQLPNGESLKYRQERLTTL